MKKLIKISLVVVFIFTYQLNFSNDTVILKNDQKRNITSILIESVHVGSEISIKDTDEQILFSEKIDKTGVYVKRFDFSNLPDGEYMIEFEKQDEINIVPFLVKDNIIERSDNDVKIAKPIVEQEDDQVYISLPVTKQKSVTIEVYFEGNELAYSEKIKNVKNLNRVYDFSTSKQGTYNILIKSGDRTFRNNVLIGN